MECACSRSRRFTSKSSLGRSLTSDKITSTNFSPKVDAPSAIDYFLGSLAADLTVGLKAQASRRNMEIDQMEVSLKAGLENVLFHLELENEGSPKIKQITGTFYVSSPNSEGRITEPMGKYA